MSHLNKCLVAALLCSIASSSHAENVFDLSYANTCRAFETFEERQEWWTIEYGPEVASVVLLPSDAVESQTRLLQLSLIENQLASKGDLDYPKFLSLNLEKNHILNTEFGGQTSLFGMAGGLYARALDREDIDINKLQVCAFECESSPSSEAVLSENFMECLG